MGLFSQCFGCKSRKSDCYRIAPSPRRSRYSAFYLPGNIERSHFVYKPRLSGRENFFQPSIQQLTQTFTVKADQPTGLPLSSPYLDLPQISPLEPRSQSPESPNIDVIYVKPALDLWRNAEFTESKDDGIDELDLDKLESSEDIVVPQITRLIQVKPVKESKPRLAQETDDKSVDSKPRKNSNRVIDYEFLDQRENTGKVSRGGNSRSTERQPGGCRVLHNRCNNNRNISSDITTITLQESSFKPQPKLDPLTMFCVTRDKTWTEKTTLVAEINKKKNKKKTKKKKVKLTTIETFVEPINVENKQQENKSKNTFKRFFSRPVQQFI